MPLTTTIKVAIKSLFANKLRSFLAMLGIIIGVGAVISMLAIGKGAREEIMDRIESMGTRLLVVRPGQSGHRGVMSGTRENLTVDDALAILNEIEDIEQVSPVVSGNAQIKYLDSNVRTNVIGIAVTYPTIRNDEVEFGRWFTEAEVMNRARAGVIGPNTAENLELSQENLGESIKIDGINFELVGILKSKGDQGWYNPDDRIYIPYTTAMKIVFGLDSLREIDVQAADGVDLAGIEEEIAQVMRRRHSIINEEDDDFYVRNQADIIEAATETNRTFTILLGAIASISLLVGGIGIMNIMLVTVTERTREIGIRKAIGARDRDILRQFLLEAFILSGIGGLIGVGIGLGTSEVISVTTEFVTLIDMPSVIIALSFACSVGIFFGYYPARRAALLDPIDSLYYE